MPNPTPLINELRSTLVLIDKQIAAIKRDVAAAYPVHIQPSDDAVFRYKNADGTYVLSPLLLAKANCLAAIANLQAKR